jgi:hypothetical protein
MKPITSIEIESRMDALERSNRRQKALVAFLGLGFAALLAVHVAVPTLAQTQSSTPQTVTLRELHVVDERGIERVRIAGTLPDPIVRGKVVPRQGTVSGILIFDSDGDERGGYVTNQNGDAFLSLDGKDYQQTLFVANRNGGANMSVWSGPNKNNNYVSVQAVPNPLIEIVQNGKRRVIGASDTSAKNQR